MNKSIQNRQNGNAGSNILALRFLTHRKAIGLVGISFPFLLVLFDTNFLTEFAIRRTVSDYYYSNFGSLFIGILFTIGFFLITYHGYSENGAVGRKILTDNGITNIAGLAAIVVALFPTCSDTCQKIYISCQWNIHGIATFIFFLATIYMCGAMFTRRKTVENSTYTMHKNKRNILFNTIAWSMGVVVVLIIFYYALKYFNSNFIESVDKYNFVFFFEVIAILLFGYSWLLKGKELKLEEPPVYSQSKY